MPLVRPRACVAACALVLAVLAVPAHAGERIHFKNGHVLEVLESRADGDSLLLKLRDGGELSVPKGLVERVEGGREVQGAPSGTTANMVGPGARSPRSTPATELRGLNAAIRGQSGSTTMQMKGVATGGTGPTGTYGFSFKGSGNQSLSPAEPVRQVHMQDVMKQRQAEAAGRPAAPVPGAPPADPNAAPTANGPMFERPASAGQKAGGPA